MFLHIQRFPRGRDLILSTQRFPRGRDRIFSTQRIFYKKNHEKSMVCFKKFSALRALICYEFHKKNHEKLYGILKYLKNFRAARGNLLRIIILIG